MNSTPDLQMSLSLPGVQFSPDSIRINQDLSGDEINQLLSFVVHCHDASNWWSGDTLAYIYQKLGEEPAREAARQFRDPTEIWDCMRVCQSLNGERIEKISFRHHRTALDECRGDAKMALRWIIRAKSENWKISELRARIRRATAITESPHDNRPSKICFTTEIKKFSEAIQDVITKRPVESWTFEECQAFLTDCKKITAMIDAVAQRYQTFVLL